MNWIYPLDLIGTFVFAVSGVLTAIDKRFDLVGSLIIGFVTAVGGGTLRDLLIGRFPVGWLTNRHYFLVIAGGLLAAYLFRGTILKLRRSMFLFDTIGIAVFTVLGVRTTLAAGLNVEVCLIMGVVSAVFGGVLRDVLTNEVPLIFRKEIYATACLAGGIVYLGLESVTQLPSLSTVVAILTVLIIRYVSVRRGWSLRVGV
ncbi:trimeric intracellular cation channel family protein [Neolewinella litorea]|uniref:Trimeric intracellular cation channel family protein n=1 Tax=Neolewinella litorea TaxID=2562452 RepID=A0A4S4NJ04_9BACT|nr:trimeric intracellular cation channel family protein [Neolewinella litorea]THH39742.1 trimeric intracellular cation channel family protein [Neolewinella litorea]